MIKNKRVIVTFSITNCLERAIWNSHPLPKIPAEGALSCGFSETKRKNNILLSPTWRKERESILKRNLREFVIFLPSVMVKEEKKIWGELKKSKTKKRKKVICKLWSRTLSSKISLNKHMRIHTSVKPFKCPDCQKCFSDSGNLCAFCQKTFNHPSNLRKHMVAQWKQALSLQQLWEIFFPLWQPFGTQTRTGERRYKCSRCNHLFTSSSHMTNHKRMHTKERPYVCSQLNKGFCHT